MRSETNGANDLLGQFVDAVLFYEAQDVYSWRGLR